MSSDTPPKTTSEIRAERSRKQAIEGEKARAELAAEALEVEARTKRLRALRLEKERADAQAAAELAAAKPAKAVKGRRKAASS